MHIWVVYDKERYEVNREFGDMLLERIAAHGSKGEIVIVANIFSLSGRVLPDLAIMRCYNYAISEYLEKKGVKVANSSYTAFGANDKLCANYTLRNSGHEGLPMISPTDKKYDPDKLVFPLIAKSRFGHGGTEVFKVDSRAELDRLFKRVDPEKYIVQQMATDLGRDARIYMLGNDMVTCILRTNDHDFRSNFSLGGKAEVFEPTLEMQRIALVASLAFNSDFIGVDFVFDHGEPVFNEVEDVVGCRMVYSVTDIDIADEFIKYLLERYGNLAK